MPFYVGGTAGIRNMGTYAAGTTYFPNDMVQYQGSSYIATTTTTGNLPTVTANWSVLAAGSGGTAAGHLSPWKPGRYYTSPNSGNITTTAPTANTSTNMFPLFIPNACTLQSISITVTTASAGTWMVSLWSDSPTATSGGPSARLAVGTASTASTGLQTVSVSVAFTEPTLIWFSHGCTATGAFFRTFHSSAQVNNFPIDPTNGTNNAKVTTAFTASTAIGSVPADLSGTVMTHASAVPMPQLFFSVA